MTGKKKNGEQLLPAGESAYPENDEEGPTNTCTKVTEKHGKQGRAQRMKDQNVAACKVNPECDAKNGETVMQPVTDEEDMEYDTAEEEDDVGAAANFDPDETILIPGYLFDEDIPYDGADEEMQLQSDSNLQWLRKIEELKRALEDMEPNESPGVFESNDQQFSESNTSSSYSEFLQRSKCVVGTYKTVNGLEDDSDKNGGGDCKVSSFNEWGKENSLGESGVSVEYASVERNKAVPVPKSSAKKFGFGSWLKFLFRNNDEEQEEGIVPRAQNLGEHLEDGSDILQPGKDENFVIRQAKRQSMRLNTPQTFWKHQAERPIVQLPMPVNLRHGWLEKYRYARRLELDTTGYSYEGEIFKQKMHGCGCLMLNERENIWGTWEENQLMELQSCQLRYKEKTVNIVKRRCNYLLTIYEHDLVATVKINRADQLDFNSCIGTLKDAFFRKLTALEILRDESMNKRQESLNNFESLLINMTGENADPIVRVNIFGLLKKYSSGAKSMQQPCNNAVLCGFIKESTIPSTLRNAANALRIHDVQYCDLNSSFMFLSRQIVHVNFQSILANNYEGMMKKHRETLINVCSSALPSLKSVLRKLDDSKIVFATKADIDVFDQLASQPFSAQYKNCLENLVERFDQTFDRMPANSHPSAIIPIMSPVFEFLVRSFWEIITEIIATSDGHNYESMLQCEAGKWIIREKIKWSTDEKSNSQENGIPSVSKNDSFYHRALEVQYKIIFEILKHAFPKMADGKRFDYKFFVLGQDSSLQEGLLLTRRSGEVPRRFQLLSEGRLVWLFILDHTIYEVFKNDPKYPDVLKQCDSLLQAQVQFIENSSTESLESFRVLTHNTVKLVMSSAPYVRVTTEQPERVDVEPNKLGIDVEILFHQISTAYENIDNDPLAFSSFRDLVTEYNNYFSLRHLIDVGSAPGYFSDQLTHMMQTFMCIIEASLKKCVPTPSLVSYFRCLNDFLDDFKCIDFMSMWYIKYTGFGDQKAIEKIDNKLAGKNCSYRVINIEKFVAEYQNLDQPTPHHYIIQVVMALFECINKCLHKQWQSNEDQIDVAQLKATGILLDAVRRSFVYLKEQPDYVNFKTFRKESVDPFSRLVEECSTLNELKNRANIVKESFYYLRKMDEIDIEQALVLLKDANPDDISDQLLSCYNLYLSNYNKYIEEYTSVLARTKSHAEGLNAVKQMLKPAQPLHFTKWSEQFKTEEIPVFLAGTSAIWSILISKDISSTGKYLKPHCIQILCILRLLSVGHSATDNHLAQVLTGQGKSVILGLLSAILALTGHDVRVMCYSKYLSSRDEDDFKGFFQAFQISDKIDYGTFEEMANSFLRPTFNGEETSLREMAKDKVLNHTDWTKMGSVANSENTVLLIDEVDVFFSEHFYGNKYYPAECVSFRGLAEAQKKMWSLAKTGSLSAQEIVIRTKEFIRKETAAGNTLFCDLNTFLNKPGMFSLLKTGEGGNLAVNRYTNQTFFDEHLLEMANIALNVAIRGIYWPKFVINSRGIICTRVSNLYQDEWRTHDYWRYYNTFHYFRLKGSNYNHKDYQNYGYMILTVGIISYARLPSQFRLILGVSGTLKNLSEYEKSGLESYKILNTTILPSFYGEANLSYDVEADFHYHTEEQNWLKSIYNSANKIVQSSRAVLIFFESDFKMGLFTKEYTTKFDRMNIMTSHTGKYLRDMYIEQSGLPGAVTLATRVMGRGVDYKSSPSVEKQGGVHVIQTFFSTDIKEEIQIKGRTARKDNKGTYEIIICKTHLVEGKVIENYNETEHTYETLSEIREKLSKQKGKTVTKNINDSERDHQTTMKYFGMA